MQKLRSAVHLYIIIICSVYFCSDIIHKFIRDKYSKRFPELESLVPNALDYIRTVKVGRGAAGTVESDGRNVTAFCGL